LNTSRVTLRWTDVAFIGVAASFSYLELMADNPVGLTHPERLIGLMFVGWIFGIASALLMMRLGTRRAHAVIFVSFLILVFNTGTLFLRRFGPLWGRVLAVVLIAALGLLISRIDSHRFLMTISVALVVFLAASPFVALYESLAKWGEDVTQPSGEIEISFDETPDLFLVVVDGYGGLVSMEEDFDIVTPAWAQALGKRGFEIPRSSWSAYSSTTGSVPSILDMSYPLPAGPGVSTATEKRLYSMISGENAMARILNEAGYTLTMIESGWSGSACGTQIDVCVASPFLDEATFAALNRTFLRPHILESQGYSFTAGAQGAMSWLLENGGGLSANHTADFVFAHIMAPHPPFFLSRDCETIYDPETSGVTFLRLRDEFHDRVTAYLEQAGCIDSFMASLADSLSSSTVVVFVADHGTDIRNQLAQPPEDWDFEEIQERFNVLLSVKAPGCTVGDAVILPNLFRRILSCLAIEDLPDLEPAMFSYAGIPIDGKVSPVIRVEDRIVEELLGS
jgi:hypothetical protein